MKRLEITNSECLAEGKKDNRDKEEFSRFKKFMDVGKELLKKTTTWALVGATVAFMACGGPGKNGPEDGDADMVEMVEDGDGVDAPDVPDTLEEEIDADVPADLTEEDVEDDGELPPLECPTPVENTPPDLNDIFENSWADRLATGGGEIDSDAELHLSMNPAGTYEECPNPSNGGYELVCSGDTVDVDGQYYLSVGESDFNAVLEPASDITEICPTASPDYPIVVYGGTHGTVKNVTYDFGGFTVESIAEFSMSGPEGLFFNVGDGSSYTRYDTTSLSFTTPSNGEYIIYFMRDAAAIDLEATSIDGRGNESTVLYALNAPLERNSKELYVYSFAPEDRANHDVDVLYIYSDYTICARCSGGPTHYEVSIPLTLDPAITSPCGELGLPSDIRAEVTDTEVLPPHIASTMSVSLRTNISRINGPSDSPALILSVDYSGPSDTDAMNVRVNANIIVEGVGHVCSGAVPFTASYPTIVSGTDTYALFYSTTCGCTFGG